MAASEYPASVHLHHHQRYVLGKLCTTVHGRPTHIGPWPLKKRASSDPAGSQPAKRSLQKASHPRLRPAMEKRHSISEVLKSVDEQCKYIEALMRWDDEQIDRMQLSEWEAKERGCKSAPTTPMERNDLILFGMSPQQIMLGEVSFKEPKQNDPELRRERLNSVEKISDRD